MSGKDHKNYWLNQHLKYFTGEYQRLFASYGYTLIEQILALAAIELEEIGVYGMENNGKGKKEIKNALLEAKFLQIPDEKVNFRQSKKIDVYVPTTEARAGQDKIFINNLIKFFEDKGSEAVAKELDDIMENKLNECLAYALQRIGGKLEGVRPSKRAKKQYVKDMFVELTFDQIPAADLNKITAEVLKYIHAVRDYSMGRYQRKNWEADNADGQMAKYIDQQITYLCKMFYRTGKVDFVKGSNKDNIIMGFFGELENFGRTLFNIKKDNENIEVFNIGGLLNEENRKQLGIDNVLIVNGNKYGIQVKNPFSITKTKTQGSYYRIYASNENSVGLDEVEKIRNIFNFSEEEYEQFVMYNLNINNSSNPEKLKQDLEQFCFLYSDIFARMDTQEISAQIKDEQNEYLEYLGGESVNNVFFVLKGQIFPCSYIVEGLIKQYNFFLESWKDYNKKNNTYKKTLVINYTNDVRKNLVNSQDERKLVSQGHVKGGGEEHIKKGADLNQYLQKIKYRHYIRLSLPGIDITKG